MDLNFGITPIVNQLFPFCCLHIRWRFFGQQLFSCKFIIKVLPFQEIPLLLYSLLNDISACRFASTIILDIHIQP
jgi:hypothetical protein